MKTTTLLLALASLLNTASAATTINSANKFAYGANIGWMDWSGDVASGAVVGEFVCSGFIYSANVGWIDLGDGTPGNGIRYQNMAAGDFGVNHDGAGTLSGFAHGANIGWIHFTNGHAGGGSFDGPRVDLRTGKLSGFVWSANCGWISLSDAFAFVQTDSIPGGNDTDGDGLPDAWELTYANNLSTLNGSGDNDSDGFSDSQEYLADTNPTDPNSLLRITAFAASAQATTGTITWTSRPTRQYHVQKRDDLSAGFVWSDAGLGRISPDSGPTTTRSFADAVAQHRFFRMEAVRPLTH